MTTFEHGTALADGQFEDDTQTPGESFTEQNQIDLSSLSNAELEELQDGLNTERARRDAAQKARIAAEYIPQLQAGVLRGNELFRAIRALTDAGYPLAEVQRMRGDVDRRII